MQKYAQLTQKLVLYLKDTLTVIWKSANIFIFKLKYVENFTLKSCCFLSYAHGRYVKGLFTNIQKQ